MPKPDDIAYLYERASEEHDRAERATDPSAAAVHRRLAEEYERRVQQILAEDGTNAPESGPA